jgi:RNA polymerase sigma factor (sigma-70 family)
VSVVPGTHEAGLDILAPARTRRRVPARLLRLASDERLVEMLRGGSETAFEALFDRHHRGVLGFCRHMLGSVEEAEDAVQHTFLAAYRELAASKKPIVLRPWLYTIARNRCLTVLRTRSRQAVGELEDPPTEHLATEVERRHDLRALLLDVACLPDEQRAALVLSELGDMPHEEIAEVLGCRREKVKALVFQARSSLIASKAARDTSCAEIRELLANLTGGSLRRNEVRRHVAVCEGCREFRDEVRRQRRELAVVLPVAPTVGLKTAVLGGAASGAVATKVLLVAAVVGSGTAALEVKSVVDKPTPPRHAAPAPAAATPQPPTAVVVLPAPAGSSHPASDRVRRSAATTAPPAFAVPRRATHPVRHGSRRESAHLPRPAADGPPAHPVHPLHPAHPAHPVHPAKPATPTHTRTTTKPVKAPPAGHTRATTKPLKAATKVKPVKPVKVTPSAPALEPVTAKPAKPDRAADPDETAAP